MPAMFWRELIIALSSCAAIAGCQAERARDRVPFQINGDGTVVAGDELFPSIEDYQRSETFTAEGRRCATEIPPLTFAGPSDCGGGSTTIDPIYDPGEIFQIPVVVHVISRTDGTGDIPDSLIHSQIDILNEDFRAIAGSLGAPGTDSGIQFALASTDPEGNPTTGINRVQNNSWFNDSGSFKSTLRWDTSRYLNIYTNSAGGALGYATLPQYSAGSSSDGVVLLYSSVGRDAPGGGIYDKGRTGTHEVGHYLGLYHTFEDGCGTGYSNGDLIADTVPESSPQYECTERASSCGGGNNPIHNYMDYTPDECMYEFTAEQVNRMRCSIMHYRPELLTEVNATPAVGFDALADGLLVQFTDLSSDSDGAVVGWEWDFGDGAPESTQQNPMHTYNAEGNYEVTLTVTDDKGARASKSEDVLANIQPQAAFSYTATELAVQLTDESTDLGPILSWEWDLGDGNAATAQHPTHTYAAEGEYVVTLKVTDEFGATSSTTETLYIGVEPPDDDDDDDGDGDGDGDGGDDTVGGGCAVGSSTAASTPWLLALLGLLVVRRRRR